MGAEKLGNGVSGGWDPMTRWAEHRSLVPQTQQEMTWGWRAPLGKEMVVRRNAEKKAVQRSDGNRVPQQKLLASHFRENVCCQLLFVVFFLSPVNLCESCH